MFAPAAPAGTVGAGGRGGGCGPLATEDAGIVEPMAESGADGILPAGLSSRDAAPGGGSPARAPDPARPH
eukprot:10228528-Alexandrium_andersonii.AAC.1